MIFLLFLKGTGKKLYCEGQFSLAAGMVKQNGLHGLSEQGKGHALSEAYQEVSPGN
jgi:hypothetical protein